MGMVIYHYNPNTQETESRVTQDQGLPRLYSKTLSQKEKFCSMVHCYTKIVRLGMSHFTCTGVFTILASLLKPPMR